MFGIRSIRKTIEEIETNLDFADYGVKVQTMGRHSREWDLSGLIAGTEPAHIVLLLVHTVLNSSF